MQHHDTDEQHLRYAANGREQCNHVLEYVSGSQMGVRVPLGVREGTPGGTWDILFYIFKISIHSNFNNQ